MTFDSGGPIATVPIGSLDVTGRPYGLGIIARPGDEAKLLQVMAAFEATVPSPVTPNV